MLLFGKLRNSYFWLYRACFIAQFFFGDLLAGKVLVLDALTLQSRIIKLGNATKTTITTLIETISATTISVADVKQGLADGTLELLDIRTDQERDDIDIGGVHIEVDELEDNMDYLNTGITKVLYCSSGKRSGEAVKLIKQISSNAPV